MEGELRVSGFSSFLVFGVPKKLSGKPFFSPSTGCDKKKKDVVRDMEEKERERRAFLSCAGWPISVENLVFDMACLWNEGESQQSQSLLVKVGLVRLQRPEPRQNPNSQCLLVQLGLLGEARPLGIAKQGCHNET